MTIYGLILLINVQDNLTDTNKDIISAERHLRKISTFDKGDLQDIFIRDHFGLDMDNMGISIISKTPEETREMLRDLALFPRFEELFSFDDAKEFVKWTVTFTIEN